MRQLIRDANIIYYRAASELMAEASNSFAGYIWWVLQPLLALAVYYTAFRWLIPYPDQRFVLFLFIGVTVWQLWSGTLIRAGNSMITYRTMMLQMDVEKYIFPVSICLVNLVKFTVAFLLLLVLAPFLGGTVSWAFLSLPPLLLLLLMLTCGTAMVLAAVVPFFPDLIMVIDFLLHLMMFLSGVFFDLKILPAELQKLLYWNPLAVLIVQFRRVIMDGAAPEWTRLAYPLLLSLGLIALGGWMLERCSRKYPRMN